MATGIDHDYTKRMMVFGGRASLELAAKDLGLITSYAEALGVPVEQARTNARLIVEAAASQGPERDFSQVASHLRKGIAQ